MEQNMMEDFKKETREIVALDRYIETPSTARPPRSTSSFARAPHSASPVSAIPGYSLVDILAGPGTQFIHQSVH